MLRNYLVTAVRNLKNNFSHTAINVLGLSIGLACCLVVFTIINFEYSFDDWHANKEEVYRVTNIYHGDNRTGYGGIIPYPTGEVLKNEIPELEEVVLIQGPEDGKFAFTNSYNEVKVYAEDGILMTNSAYFDVLDFEIVEGEQEDLDQPFKIFLTEKLAEKYFPEESPMGKVIIYNGEHKLTVAGILQNPPNNTNLPFSSVISFETLRKIEPFIWKQWGMTWAHSIYVQVDAKTDVKALNVKIDETLDKYRITEGDEDEAAKTEVRLQPLSEIHNDERYSDGQHYVTPALMIWSFIFLGVLILGTACLNFINLNTALAIKRSKEIGIRKTLGSNKGQLVTQFLIETLVVVSIATILALNIGQFLMQGFNSLIASIEYNLQYSSEIIFFSIGMVVLVSVLAGFYPALILSGYQPVEALKNKINIKGGSGNFNLRRSLVVAQFVFTTIMLIGTLIISAQVKFMKNKDLGFDPVNVLKLGTPEESKINPEKLMEKLKTKSFVQDATLAFTSPIDNSNWNNSYTIKGEEHIDGNSASIKFIDANYMDFYDIPLLAGEPIKEQFQNDSTYNVIITEKLLPTLGWNNPEDAIGRILTNGRTEYTIAGICGDFNTGSAQNKSRPVMLMYRPEMMNQIALKVPSDNINEYMEEIEASFRAFYPNELFELSLLTQEINERYELEELLHSVIQFVSLLAIILSGMGLYGLVSFMANRSAKIIGIRKVFGATTVNILSIFTKEYVKLMVIAFVIAAPAAYYLMNIWIQEFDFRIELSVKYFLSGFGITFMIAVLTVGYRSLIAARANPIQSLRYE